MVKNNLAEPPVFTRDELKNWSDYFSSSQQIFLENPAIQRRILREFEICGPAMSPDCHPKSLTFEVFRRLKNFQSSEELEVRRFALTVAKNLLKDQARRERRQHRLLVFENEMRAFQDAGEVDFPLKNILVVSADLSPDRATALNEELLIAEQNLFKKGTLQSREGVDFCLRIDAIVGVSGPRREQRKSHLRGAYRAVCGS